MKNLFIFILFLSVFTGCNKRSTDNILNRKWSFIEQEAQNTTVTMYMWGGSAEWNNYIDNHVAPLLKNKHSITINRVPLNDIKDLLNKLLIEKKTGRNTGSTDIIWINGENFKEAKTNGLLLGNINALLPAFASFVNEESALYDFGEKIDGMETPWGEAQFVMIHNKGTSLTPPDTVANLKEWVMNNPGKFTYPAPPDFTGSAFLRHIIFEICGGQKQFMIEFNQADVTEKLLPVWDYLNELKPYLWRNGETYPESLEKLDTLYGNTEVYLTMSYNPSSADINIASGKFPVNTATYLFKNGTLFNNHYLTIPFNAPNKAGALVAINEMISPDLQLIKSDASVIGEGTIVDRSKLNDTDKTRFDSIKRGTAALPQEVLASNRIPEVSAEYLTFFEKEWIRNVANQ